MKGSDSDVDINFTVIVNLSFVYRRKTWHGTCLTTATNAPEPTPAPAQIDAFETNESKASQRAK